MRRDSDLVADAIYTPGSDGYCAPYLYLLKDDSALPSKAHKNFSRQKLKQVIRLIRAGYGQGRGDHYKPWIRIRRNFSSPVSHQVFESVAIHTRNHHFLSSLEYHTALLLAYLGCIELRECLPLWPVAHSHPCVCTRDSTQIPGLLEIASQAGIEHGFFVGTRVPYVASMDMLAHIRFGKSDKLIGISCKPAQITAESARARERIELDRRYCIVIDAHHVHEDGLHMNPMLLSQLDWMRPLTSEVRQHQGSSQLQDFCSRFNELATQYPIRDAINLTAASIGCGTANVFLLWRLGIWLHQIDIDLSQKILMSKPRCPGADKVLRALATRYLGACS